MVDVLVHGRRHGVAFVHSLPRAFVNAGHRMLVLMPRGDATAGHDTHDGLELVRYRGGPPTIFEDLDQSRIVRFTLRFVRYVQFQVAASIAGYRACRQVRPDALIAYNYHATPVTWLLGHLFRVPTINRFFGTPLAQYLDSPLQLCLHYIQYLGQLIPATYTISCDDGSRGDLVAAAMKVPAERFRYWRDGGDHGAYDPDADQAALRRKLGLPIQGPLLFTTSRLHPEKRIDRILRALPIVLEHHSTARFVVIGEGPERDALETQAEELGVSHAVVWVDAVDREGLVDYWNALDIFVATSDRTNAASPLFEAMLCARPPVVLDTGDTSKIIQHGVNGWLVPEDRPEELGPLLVSLLTNMHEVRCVGQRALTWARSNIPTYEERQRMEVALVELAVREARADRERS